ncbi:hypothetical protein [Ciceribacter selenitireducens]|uniref:hypothetical protein n=1 Tax=Ciceribacter selenitireducens TaxID=448181 RepID=UPI0011C07937|nr:hypothetical protein [Ciceribacter selenitireducens]
MSFMDPFPLRHPAGIPQLRAAQINAAYREWFRRHPQDRDTQGENQAAGHVAFAAPHKNMIVVKSIPDRFPQPAHPDAFTPDRSSLSFLDRNEAADPR